MTTLDQIKDLIKAQGRKDEITFKPALVVSGISVTGALVSLYNNLHLKEHVGWYPVEQTTDQSTRDAVLAKVLERLQNVKTQAV